VYWEEYLRRVVPPQIVKGFTYDFYAKYTVNPEFEYKINLIGNV